MSDLFAFDTETHRFGNGNYAPKVVCLTYDTGWQNQLLVGEEIPRELEKQLDQCIAGELTMVGHNTAYDMACLMSTFPALTQKIWAAYESGHVQCTKLRERLLDIAKGEGWKRQPNRFSLDTLTADRTDMQLDKDNPWRVRFSELEDKPLNEWPPEAVAYAKDDARATKAVYEAQEIEAKVLPYPGFAAEAARQTSYDFALYLMHCWGVRADPARLEKLQVETHERMEELKPYLMEHGIMSPKGTKKLAAIRARVEQCLASPPKTPKGATQTSKEVLEQCDDEALEALVEFNYLQKMDSTYLQKLWEGVTGNIHAEFHTLGAETGRTSCSKPPLQQQQRKGGIRECFVARESHLFAMADYDSQELRTLAQACRDIVGWSRLADKYRENPEFDPHTEFGGILQGIEYAEAIQRKKAKDERMLDLRQRAKAANFGFPGGLGAKNFRKYARSYGVKMSEDEAKQLRDQWFQQWPEMNDYFTHIKQVTGADGAGTIVQLRSGRRRGHVSFTEGANSYFQGLASDASKTAVFKVAKRCFSEPESALFDSRPVMLIHDEIMVEVPEGQAAEAAAELEECMVAAMKLWCPDVPASATPVLCKRWTKNAEPVFRDGKLVPWTEPSPSQVRAKSEPSPSKVQATPDRKCPACDRLLDEGSDTCMQCGNLCQPPNVSREKSKRLPFSKVDKALKQALNPSGLTEIYHSEKCPEGEDCKCSVAKKMKKTLMAIVLGKNPDWKGSVITTSGDHTLVKHPSGAVAKILTKVLQ